MPAIAGFVPAPIPRRLRQDHSPAARDFWKVSKTTFICAISGTILPLVLGLLAVLVAWNDFPSRQIWRGVLLFPYIVPIVAVAFVQ